MIEGRTSSGFDFLRWCCLCLLACCSPGSFVACGGRSSVDTLHDAGQPEKWFDLPVDRLSTDGFRDRTATDSIDTASFPNACKSSKCSTPGSLKTADEVLTFIASQGWTVVAPLVSTCLPVSPDAHVLGQVVLESELVPLPGKCTSCLEKAYFVIVDSISGVTCERSENVSNIKACSRVRFADATVRFRGVIKDVAFPTTWLSAPLVEIVSSCSAACGSGELRCEATSTCWKVFDDYCRFCLAGTTRVCSCYSSVGKRLDQSPCDYFVSEDQVCSGYCANGTCQPTSPLPGPVPWCEK
jgi:hypothetical protein